VSARAAVPAIVVTAVVAAACSDPSEPPLPAFSVSPRTQWSGGAIRVRSPYFASRAQAPIVVAGVDTLVLARLDDSTVTTTLPRGPTGPVTLSIARGARRDSLGSVQRVGFREKRVLTPGLMGEVMIVDSAGHPWVVANTTTSAPQYAPLGHIDLVTGAGQMFTSVLGPSTVGYGLSPSATAGTAVARDTGDTLRLYNLVASPPQPIGAPLFGGQTGYVRHLAQLSPGLWLYTQSHRSFTHAETDTTPYRTEVQTESPWSVFVSPNGTRTTMTVNVVSGGVPVFDNATGDTAFSLPLQGTEGIAFTPDGSKVYAVGGFYYQPDTIAMVDAASGALLHPKVRLLEDFIAFSLAYSTRGSGRLLVAAANASTLALLVYDATSLELLGVLPTPDNCGTDPMATSTCWDGAVAADDARGVAYLVVSGSPTPVWTFDLVSTP
jgi:hypothetical protein